MCIKFKIHFICSYGYVYVFSGNQGVKNFARASRVCLCSMARARYRELGQIKERRMELM